MHIMSDIEHHALTLPFDGKKESGNPEALFTKLNLTSNDFKVANTSQGRDITRPYVISHDGTIEFPAIKEQPPAFVLPLPMPESVS
jgi:hypothetical protein